MEDVFAKKFSMPGSLSELTIAQKSRLLPLVWEHESDSTPSVVFEFVRHDSEPKALCASVEDRPLGPPLIELSQNIMKPEPIPSDREVLAGPVERVTFHNAANGFCVLRIKARGHRELITVVGHAAVISAGEWVTASGEWVNDGTHGQQFCRSLWRQCSRSPPTERLTGCVATGAGKIGTPVALGLGARRPARAHVEPIRTAALRQIVLQFG